MSIVFKETRSVFSVAIDHYVSLIIRLVEKTLIDSFNKVFILTLYSRETSHQPYWWTCCIFRSCQAQVTSPSFMLGLSFMMIWRHVSWYIPWHWLHVSQPICCTRFNVLFVFIVMKPLICCVCFSSRLALLHFNKS